MASKHKKKSSATATVLKEQKAKFVPKSTDSNSKYNNFNDSCKYDSKNPKKSKMIIDRETKISNDLHSLKKDSVHHQNKVWFEHLKDSISNLSKKSSIKNIKRTKNIKKVLEDIISQAYAVFVGLYNLKKNPSYNEIILKTKIFASLIGMILIVFVINNMPSGYKKAYAVVLDNEVVGYLKDQIEAKSLMVEIAKEVEQKHNTEDFKLQNQLQLKSIEPGQYRETNIDDIKNNIIEKGKVLVKRYGLFVDSKAYFIFSDELIPKRILSKLKDIYYNKNSANATFKEKVEIKPVYVSPELKLSTESDVINKIMFGKEKIFEYTIKEGDTLWELSNKYNISVDDIFASNPGLSEKIMPGQKINLTKATPLINVMFTKEVEYEDVLPKPVKVIKSSNYYTTQTIVKQDGQDGKAKIKARIVYMNGLEYDRHIISQKIIKNPVERIVVVGTKKPPAYFATGRFSYPVWGTLTSRYGYRGREFHEGIDIAVPWGTNVYAADGGEVEFTGWSGGYGKLIIINHKNGYQTYYGHLSKILVYPGQKIVKGQIIAKSGSTGRSTGPHLHFEVRKNGVAQNPLRYLQ